jgi:hypothetical protein
MSKARKLANLLSSAGKVEVGNIADGTITAAKLTDNYLTGITAGSITNTELASGAAVANVGFTPANIAGATFTGAVNVTGALVATGDVTAYGTI